MGGRRQADAVAAPILRVERLKVVYEGPRGSHVAVSDVSFDIRPGEIVALVGESGSGKSTTASAVMGFLGGSGRIVHGAIEVDGVDITACSDREMDGIRGVRIGFVPQDPTVSLNPMMRIGRQIAEALIVHGKAGREQAARRAVEILAESGLPDPELHARQFPHQLSGGMRQRVLIGIAMACRPSVIIADEPTSALDVTVQRTILDHLDRVIDETGVGVLLITHDFGVAIERSDRIIVLHEGEIVESDTPERILHHAQHPYTRRLIAAAPSLSSERMTPSATVDTPTPPPAPSPAAEPLLRVDGLSKTFRGPGGEVTAVEGVSFDLAPGKTLAVVGESGSGKTTTARMIMRLVDSTSGSIRFEGEDITGLRGVRLRALRRRMQFVYQNPYTSLDPRMSVSDIVAEPLRAFGVPGRKRIAAEVIDRVALPSTTLKRRARELSGGQRQRVAIARALALNPRLIILDEPVSALDVSIQERVLRLLVDLQAEYGLSYLFITHDLAVVRQISDDVAVMRRSRLVEYGATADVLASPRHPYTAELLAAIPGAAGASPSH
ncbi:MAG: ABC transporter ATP-binding protein [Microbacterium sp.]